MTTPRLSRIRITDVTVALTQLADALPLVVEALRRAFAALGRALRYYATAMFPPIAAEHLTSPRTERRRHAAQRNPAERRAFRLAHRAHRRWLRHQGRTR